MTPEDIYQIRQRARGILDEIGTNSVLRAQILVGNQHDRMRPHLQQIQQLIKEHPQFFSRFDYSWAPDAASYDTAIEAAWQLRALRALTAIHSTNTPSWTEKNLQYGNIIITYQLIVNYVIAGANYRKYDQISVVRLPFGFMEVALM